MWLSSLARAGRDTVSPTGAGISTAGPGAATHYVNGPSPPLSEPLRAVAATCITVVAPNGSDCEGEGLFIWYVAKPAVLTFPPPSSYALDVGC